MSTIRLSLILCSIPICQLAVNLPEFQVGVIVLIFIYHSCRYGWNSRIWKRTAWEKWLRFCQSSIKTIRDGSPLGRQTFPESNLDSVYSSRDQRLCATGSNDNFRHKRSVKHIDTHAYHRCYCTFGLFFSNSPFHFQYHFTSCKIKCPTKTSVLFSKTMSCIKFTIV